MTRFIKVISGGQTGADIGGLRAADERYLPTGGHAPKGFRTERGNDPILGKHYGLVETASESYVPRTKINIQNADITLIFGDVTGGTKLTKDFCREVGKPYVIIKDFSEADMIACFNQLKQYNQVIINIAGNRESKNKGISKRVEEFCVKLFTLLEK